MLGHLVKQEREKAASEEARRPNRRKYSEPAKTTEEAMQEYSQKHDLRQPENA